MPGEMISASELTARLNVGRAPLREALTRLTSEGLLINRPRQGYEVAPLTLSDMRSLFEARRSVDPDVAVLAARNASTEDLERVAKLANHPSDTGDYSTSYDPGFMEANAQFHEGIADQCSNRLLAGFARKLNDASQRFHYFQALTGHMAPSCISTHHQELADALVARDNEAVRRLTIEHIDEEEQHLLETLSDDSLLGAVNLGALA